MAVKAFNTLIKLHKRRIDVLRREMIVLEEEHKQLVALADTLRQEHAREMRLSTTEPKMAAFFGAYSARMKERQAKIAQEIKRLDTAISEKSEAISEEFSEQKKFEIAREHANKRAAHVASLRMQQRFDEIGTQQYIKRKDSPL